MIPFTVSAAPASPPRIQLTGRAARGDVRQQFHGIGRADAREQMHGPQAGAKRRAFGETVQFSGVVRHRATRANR
jgi:hypothetical protein